MKETDIINNLGNMEIKPDQIWVDKTRQRLTVFADTDANLRGFSVLGIHGWRAFLTSFLALVLLIGSPVTVFALADDSAPGDLLYSLDTWIEERQLEATPGLADRVEFRMGLLEERMGEWERLKKGGVEGLMMQARMNYEANLGNLSVDVDELHGGQFPPEMKDRMRQMVDRHHPRLERLDGSGPIQRLEYLRGSLLGAGIIKPL